MGEVYETKLNDVEHAIETYSGILDLDPTDWTAISALDHLYLTAQRWYDLLQILEREVELSGTSAETVVFKYRIGELYQTQLRIWRRRLSPIVKRWSSIALMSRRWPRSIPSCMVRKSRLRQPMSWNRCSRRPVSGKSSSTCLRSRSNMPMTRWPKWSCCIALPATTSGS